MPKSAPSPEITISVISRYLPIDSYPDENQYVFSYTVTIHNQSDKMAKLLSRQWVITDANEHVQTVQGEGVVGKQPRLQPGESFQYTSATMIPTPVGTMHGSYRMIDEEGNEFDVAIPVFSLVKPNMLH